MRRTRSLWPIVGLVSLSLPAGLALPASADTPPAIDTQACECQTTAGYWPDAGVLYRGKRSPSFQEIVTWCAPGLWFSPDEPLLLEGRRNIPSAHPCDTPSDSAVVYWQLEDALLRGAARVTEPVERDSAFFDKVSSITLIYFFYYPKDVGMGGHVHDIEGVRMHVQLEDLGDGCKQLRLELAEAFAHGMPWYANRLKPPHDTRFPLMLFVEEGKHASCPDRNAVPTYNPGYDINQFVNDGWGVRDVFGAGFLFTGNYQGWMTKARLYEHRLFPPVDEPPPCIPATLTSMTHPENSLGHYQLRSGMSLPQCAAMGTGRDSSFLHTMMVTNGLGDEVPLQQFENRLGHRLARVKGAPQLFPGVALKWDQGEVGLVFNLMGIDVHEGWLVPRVKIVNGYGVSLLWTRSAARWSDAYFLGGWEYQPAKREMVNGVEVETRAERNEAVWETGMKVRVGLPPGWIRWIFLDYRLAGVRAGVRFNGVDQLRNARFSVELGAGVW